MKNDYQMALRLPSVLLKKLDRLAKAERLNRNAFIRRVLFREAGMLKSAQAALGGEG